MKTTQARLLNYLAEYGRKYPDAWAIAEEFRADRSGLPDWSAWCYLPMSGWYSVISSHLGGRKLNHCEGEEIGLLAALGAWRYTQGIYRYNHAIFEALADTPISGDIPVGVLFRLPEWCVYIETPDKFFTDGGICGFFAFLEQDVKDGSKELRFVIDSGASLANGPIIHLGDWSVAHSIEILVGESDAGSLIGDDIVNELADFAGRLLSIVLYLCSDEPDIDGHTPGSRPHYASYTRTKRGLRLFPPDKPRVWRIGEETGAAIERGRVAASASGGERKGPRPHMRRAHWHGFWSGAIKQRPGEEKQPERRFGYKWLPPIVVGIGDDDGE